MKLFLDSSVLVPVFLADHPHHAPSLGLYTKCGPETACCAVQSLAEVYATLTRLPLPHRATLSQAVEFLESMHASFRFVSLDADDYLSAIREASANRISGGSIYDALIAKCAVRAGAETIFTRNTRHYLLLGEEVCKRIKTPVHDSRLAPNPLPALTNTYRSAPLK